jgi:hypothetical protein
LYYPYEEKFNSKNFAKCPLILIEKALEVARQRDLELAAMAAHPTASLGVSVLRIAGAKNPKTQHFNPYAAQIYEDYAKKLIPQEAAKCFLNLIREGKIPSWAVKFVDIELIKAAAHEIKP